MVLRNGYEPELAPVLTGSHIDAIPYSGKYDGVVGVLGAIEAINVLKRYAQYPDCSTLTTPSTVRLS